MLQLETIHKETFALLESFMELDALNDFALAGGTGLALCLGHRVSIDLDFFTTKEFDTTALLEELGEQFTISNAAQSRNSLSLFVGYKGAEIKVDCIRHNYPLLDSIQHSEQMRLYSLKDIGAMKLNAIANRGFKKDFYDIHALLKQFSLKELLMFFEKKYQQMNTYSVVKSLVYFEDADIEPGPMSLVGLPWSVIKRDICGVVGDL